MQAKTWEYVLNNYQEADIDRLRGLGKAVRRMVVAREIGESGTPHLQGRITFAVNKTLAQVKKLDSRAHWEKTKCEQDWSYYYKGGDVPIEIDNRQQGQRTDLDDVANRIKEGTSVDEITLEKPTLYHQYGRTLEKLEDLRLRKQKREWMTKGIWIYGPTGSGKSHMAFTMAPNAYVWPDDGQWWDAYKGQSDVIINDFRGQIAYDKILRLVDKWPETVNRRGREPVPFLAQRVIVTSALPPEECYPNRCTRDDIAQLKRRFEVIHLPYPNTPHACPLEYTEVVREGNTDFPDHT